MNVFTLPGVADIGMVWMGAGQAAADMSLGLIPNETNELMLEQDSPYYTPSHHSASNHSLDDIQNMHNSPMVMEGLDMLPMVDIKQDSNGSYIDDDNSEPVYMINTATQTIPCPTRKIKPVKHPGLVLKTPIAYQSNTDPSVIPIQKDGIAICEKCGAMGVKHAFYTRERRFCSMACARGYSGLVPEPLPQSPQTTPEHKPYAHHSFKLESQEDLSGLISDQPLPQLVRPPELQPIDDNLPLTRRKPPELANTFDWDRQLETENFVAAPVTCFKHVPMADIWGSILPGMKVEVENTDCDNISDTFPDSFWVATVMKIIGYKALLRYEGFGSNSTKDFWVSLCSNQVHPVGWCATRGKPLIPPKTIEDKYGDWKDFLRKRLTGARTLPSNYSNKINDSLKSRFQCGLNLEVVDKNRISQVKVAMIHKIVGKRLNVKYYDMPPDDAGFWCHEDSPLLHPVGWAKKVGHHLVAPLNYLEKVHEGIFDEEDATDELFTPFQVGFKENTGYSGFSIGMKLEAIDPLNLSSICVATVMDVLNYGYIMIRIDTYDSDATGADWFCYHVSSPCIFPVGFCEKNNIPLTPPKGYDQFTFDWNSYLQNTYKVPVTVSLINHFVPTHGFREGMKIEAADLMDPRLVCVATVAKVVGRLLKVHFDGWEEEYDQWLDCESPDIYPVGWCQSVGHKLEGPKQEPKLLTPPKEFQLGMKKRGRKKKIKETSSPKALSQKSVKSEDSMDVDPDRDMKSEADIEEEPLEVESNQQDPTTGNNENLGCLPPAERKATSYINTSNNTSTKLIPRLIDSSGGSCESSELCPDDWNVFDVAQFLRVNDCANYCDSFSKQKVDGKTLLYLSKEDILAYTGGKVGPSLKIFDLIQQLKVKMNPSQSRHLKVANIKKFL
ncbi:polycomb protein Sfmbt isoform X2 [Onthophagus taurus]|uniref:polycomb protein Sfmbt isoform X2 n=1 Tax=Onthophagus taurus TaxID=166361 RepID=UPI000C2042EF|nr:polycomb protein Sfmbt isoform X2 [Onthophagus taurus]